MKGEIKEYRTTDGNIILQDEEGNVTRIRVKQNEDGSISYIEDPEMSYLLVEDPFKGYHPPHKATETDKEFYKTFAIVSFIFGAILFVFGQKFIPYLVFSAALLFSSMYCCEKGELDKNRRLESIGHFLFLIAALYFIAGGVHYLLYEWNWFG